MVGAPEAVEIIDVQTTQCTSGACRRCCPTAGPWSATSPGPRRRKAAARPRAGCSKTLTRPGDVLAAAANFAGGGLERGVALVAPILHHHLEAARVADALHGRRRETQPQIPPECPKPSQKFFWRWRARSGPATSARRTASRRDEERPRVGTVDAVKWFVTGELDGVDETRRAPNASQLAGAFHHVLGAVQRGRVGQPREPNEITLILRGDETPWARLLKPSQVNPSSPA